MKKSTLSSCHSKFNIEKSPTRESARLVKLFILFALWASTLSAQTATPILIAKAGTEPYIQPTYSPSGDFLAFSTASQRQIYVYDCAKQDTHCAMSSNNPIRRFCFDPTEARLIYRHFSMGDPNRSERLFSIQYYLFDPLPLTTNIGKAYGPYNLSGKIWYRENTDKPLLDYKATPRIQGLYYNLETDEFWVKNEAGDTISDRASPYRIEGGEYSPDGRYFAAVTTRPDRHILLINLIDGTTVDLAQGAHPAWSGDSRLLAYHSLSLQGEPTFIQFADMLTREKGYIDIGKSEIVTDLALNYNATKLIFANRNGDLYQIPVVKYIP